MINRKAGAKAAPVHPATATAEGDGKSARPTPLSSVLSVLKNAQKRGELSPTEIEWSVARLSGKVQRGNPRLEGVDRRESILRASAEVFRRRGYNHATIDEIASELFLTKAGVYHYFASKQEILENLCSHAMTAAEEAVKTGLAAESEPFARLRRMLSEYVKALIQEPAFTVLMRHLDEVSDVTLSDLQRRRKRIEAEVHRTLEDGIKSGVFEVPDTRIAVFSMLGAINWLYAWYEPHGRLDADEVREALVALALNGILSRPKKIRS